MFLALGTCASRSDQACHSLLGLTTWAFVMSAKGHAYLQSPKPVILVGPQAKPFKSIEATCNLADKTKYATAVIPNAKVSCCCCSCSLCNLVGGLCCCQPRRSIPQSTETCISMMGSALVANVCPEQNRFSGTCHCLVSNMRCRC